MQKSNQNKNFVLVAFLNRYSFGILDSEEMVKKYAKSADQKL